MNSGTDTISQINIKFSTSKEKTDKLFQKQKKNPKKVATITQSLLNIDCVCGGGGGGGRGGRGE